MLRTVSAGIDPKDIRRDDIWQGYFALIGCARRFIFMENQYFHEPAMADAIVKQSQAQPELIVVIVVSFETDDPDNPLTQHMHFMRHEFFTRLCNGIPANRRRVYTMTHRLVHSKFAMVDDRAMTVGSANANPRGFFLDSELNIMLDDPEIVRNFRHHLWAHDLGVSTATVAGWRTADFLSNWDRVAKANAGKAPKDMAGEGVVLFDKEKDPGARSVLIPDVLTESAEG
jgi:phosphatidylserine/phosphatidylglycerophosphate/cardiolipin synthase-like enzyme